MKYVLIDTHDNIVDRVQLASEVGVSGAKTFFIGRKHIGKKEFNKLWSVMTENEYHKQYHSTNRPPSYAGIKWWEEEQAILKDEWDKY